jgi:hypothetical protein
MADDAAERKGPGEAGVGFGSTSPSPEIRGRRTP